MYTLTSYLAIHNITIIAQHLHDVNHFPLFQPCIIAMKEKYNKYRGPCKIPFLYGFGCILDPRIKFEGYRHFLQYLVDMTGENYILSDRARVVEGFYSLFTTYQSRLGPQPELSPPHNQSTSTSMFQQLYQYV